MPLRRHLIVIVIVVVSKVRNLGLPRRCCMERWRRTLNPVRTIEIQSVPSRPKEFYQLQKNDMTTTTTSPGNHPFEGLPVPRVPPSGNRAKPTQLLKLVLAFGDPTSMTYLTRVPRKQKVHNYIKVAFPSFPPHSVSSAVFGKPGCVSASEMAWASQNVGGVMLFGNHVVFFISGWQVYIH